MTFWQRAHEGYLLVDHRASPGLPEDIARTCGYDPRHCAEGKMYETATLGCAHCNCAVVKNPFRSRERASCLSCSGRYICDVCDYQRNQPGYVHMPFDKQVDLIQNGVTLIHDSHLGPIVLRKETANG